MARVKNDGGERKSRKFNSAALIFWSLFALLALSLVYSIVMAVVAPADDAAKGRGDYALNIMQSILGLVVIFAPSIVKKTMKIEVPSAVQIVYFVFLFAAIYLGEIRSFFYRVPHWDVFLHTFSSCMLGALGFFVVDFLNKNKLVVLNPFFVALFAFCFALMIGTVWEIFEFAADGIFKTNMQKFVTADGARLVGRDALSDTMKDIIVDALGALATCTAGYFYLKLKRKKEDGAQALTAVMPAPAAEGAGVNAEQAETVQREES